MEENFSLLETIVQKNIAETKDPANFNWTKFIAEMEIGFTELGFREPSTEERGVDNVLILRLDSIGDFVNTTAAMRELRKNLPFSYITLVANVRNKQLANVVLM